MEEFIPGQRYRHVRFGDRVFTMAAIMEMEVVE